MRNEQSVGKSEATVSDGVSLDVLAVVVEDEEERSFLAIRSDHVPDTLAEGKLVHILTCSEVVVLGTSLACVFLRQHETHLHRDFLEHRSGGSPCTP